MSSQGEFDQDMSRRAYGKPYGSKHPIPTIQGYKQHRAELHDRLQETEEAQDEDAGQDDSRTRRAFDSLKAIAKDEDKSQSDHNPYPAANRNFTNRPRREKGHDDPLYTGNESDDGSQQDSKGSSSQEKSATETATGHIDPKQKRKDMKKIKRTGGGREVTDPVTHLPVTIHDQTDKDLKSAPENESAPGLRAKTLTGLSGASKSKDQLDDEKQEMDRYHKGILKLFPPPSLRDTRSEMTSVYRLAFTAGLASLGVMFTIALTFVMLLNTSPHHTAPSQSSWMRQKAEEHRSSRPWISMFSIVVVTSVLSATLVGGISSWLQKRLDDVFEDEIWDAARQEEIQINDSEFELPESVAWLNSLLASVWPLVNPDLFASLVDTLEDVMQASLPKVVRMVSVDDLGQGNESIRILGVRWLPTGAAGRSVDAEGNFVSENEPQEQAKSNRESAHGKSESQSQEQSSDRKSTADAGDQPSNGLQQGASPEGMEAEEGDFVNLELAFAYRARSSGKSISSKAKNAHLYLKFYLPGGIAVPVWVELRGIVGVMRMRLQLTPDPPFFGLCTLTFLGQPRADLSCVPLSKHSLNLMDVPLISSFVQSAIDAALAEYVAPKSLTLDLKDMLVGDDFKKDTLSRGVVLVYIKQARGFKEGDGGIGPIKGSSDSYVTLSWGKFGKPVAATRIIEGDQSPNWHEWHSILVSMDEINAEEKLRVQIWDSDKFTADDDLGRVELDLQEIMNDTRFKNQMMDRQDELTAEDPDEKMPGSLSWSVGYFAKTHIQQCQLDQQTINNHIRSRDAMRKHVSETAAHKLREATTKDESRELKQQKAEDFRELEDLMIASAPPPDDWHSGVFSIHIHNITGLEVARLNNKEKTDHAEDREDEAETSENLPDSYCTIILNHKKIYRTRTKPRNSKPFFNAATERFIRDWKTAEVMISVRDSREREDDPLLGMIYLPLGKIFAKKSQIMQTYPLAGGMGYGKARISMVWRSVELKMPVELTGWDYGTLEVHAPVQLQGHGNELGELKISRIKLRSRLGKASLRPRDSEDASKFWPRKAKQGDGVFLPVRKRYQSALILEFRKSSWVTESTPAFAIYWLHDIPDEEEKTVKLRVWRGGKDNLRRAESSCDYKGLEADEQDLGEVEVTMKFWKGLSGYHMHYANKSSNGDVRNVMECLDTINDEKMGQQYESDDNDSSNSDSSSDSDTSSNDDDVTHESRKKQQNQPTDSPEDVEKRKKLRKYDATPDDAEESDDMDGNKVTKPAKKAASLPKKLKDQASALLDGQHNGNGNEDHEDDGSRGIRGQVADYKKHHKQLHRKHRGVMQWRGARSVDWLVGKAKRATGRMGEVFEHSDKDQGIETEV